MIELRVNESALLQRVETRVAEMRARGEEVRIDDTPEVLTKRLASYRSLTEPLIHYYSERRKLLTVDGMMTIEHVTREINRILAAIGAVEAKSSRQGSQKGRQESRPGKGRQKAPSSAAARRLPEAPERPPRHARKAGKSASKGGEKAVPQGSGAVPKPAPPGSPRKPLKRSRKSELKHRDG